MVDRDQQPDHVKVYEEVERLSPDDKVMYMQAKIPFMSVRETIMRMKREKLEDGSWVVTMRSMEEHPKVPVNPSFIRNEMLVVRWIKENPENPKDLDVIGFSNVDMKGYFPSRLMNMAISSMMGKAVKMWYAKASKVKKEFEEQGKLPK
uniref:START domain-containing protein n=1 Tax=Strombidium inclinatum TaxID=197538 RepID=A0A7S3IVQ2_9SPIT